MFLNAIFKFHFPNLSLMGVLPLSFIVAIFVILGTLGHSLNLVLRIRLLRIGHGVAFIVSVGHVFDLLAEHLAFG